MATSNANVRQGSGSSAGGVYFAPLGTTMPTNPTTAYGGAVKELGIITEAGIVETPTMNTADQLDRNGNLARRFITGSTRTFEFTVVETNPNQFAVTNPGSTQVTASSVNTQTIKVPVTNPLAWAFDFLDGSIHTRIVVPKGEVTSVGAVTRAVGGAITYDLTVSLYPDSAGTYYYLYTDDPAFP